MPVFQKMLHEPASLPLVAPSILSADFARMGEECRTVLEHGAHMLHLDVMDGHFVPNLTMGPDMCRWLRRFFPDTFLDVHLMVTDPAAYVDPFVKAGANLITFHVEAVGAAGVRALIEDIQSRGISAGLAINPPTHLEAIEPFLDLPDLVLVMSVNPGFSGQSFITQTLEKTRVIAGRLRPNQRLQMDGGIGPQNAATVRAAGCDVLVAASALFGVPPAMRGGVIARLMGAAA